MGIGVVSCALPALAQTPPPKSVPAPRLVFWVTTSAWPDGAEMRHAARSDNKSPAFEFHWNLGSNPATAPDTVKSYALIFHDVENSTAKTATDTLHWSAFNIPGTANGIAEGLRSGDLPDGTRNGRGSPLVAGSRRPISGLVPVQVLSITMSLSFTR
jgi:phosphatidylethanolamine-binding protein (PEBP) family uncharacterized protein